MVNVSGRQWRWATLGVFSTLYFVDACLRAYDKFFWYDEVFTVYFCRLSSLKSLWNALQSGIDFNPPFFYMLTRVGQAVFGDGHVGTRIVEIVAFWIFSICLFRFVSRRAGLVAGTIAMLLPIVTQAYYWAYEARPHGIVLGFCGLALVTWQMIEENESSRRRWLALFALSLSGAMMMHCFAIVLVVPFALVELFRIWRDRLVRLDFWFALVMPPVIASVLYVPLLTSYRKLTSGNRLLDDSAAGWTRFEHFYWFLFQPCILVVFAAMVFFALGRLRSNRLLHPSRHHASSVVLPELVKQELLLGVCFALLPLFGIALGKVVHAPFFNRYYLSSVAGVSIITGFGAGLKPHSKWMPAALVLVLVLTAGANFTRLVLAKARGEGELLILPDSVEEMETTPGRPLLHHPLLAESSGATPIAVLDPFDFIYLIGSAPERVQRRIYFASETTADFAYGGFTRFLQNTPVSFHTPTTIEQFTKAHPAALMYGKVSKLERLEMGEQYGCRIEHLQVSKGHFLAQCGNAREKEGT